MILLTIGLFIGASIGFIFAAIIACGKSAEGSTIAPLCPVYGLLFISKNVVIKGSRFIDSSNL